MSSAPVGPGGSVCTTCGEAIEPGTMFCGSCGSRVPVPAGGSPAHPTYPAPTSTGPVPAVPTWAAVETPTTPAPEPLPLLADPPGAVSPYPAPDAFHGTPAPARAARPTPEAAVAPGSVAPVPVRVGAYAIDVALTLVVYVGALLVVRGATSGSTTLSPLAFLPGLLLLVVGLAQWISEAVTGATFGGVLTGIRTLSAETGRPAGLLRVLLRNLVVAAGALACGIGAFVVQLSGLWDQTPAQRGWHDKAAGTVVLRASASGRRPAQPDAAAWDSAVARAVGRPAPSGDGAPVDDPTGVAPAAGLATDAAPLPTLTGALPSVASPSGPVPSVAAPSGSVPSVAAPPLPVPAPEAVALVPPAPAAPTPGPGADGVPGLITGPPPGVGRHAAPHAGTDVPVVAPVTASLPVIDAPGTSAIGTSAAPSGTPGRAPEPASDAGLGDLEHTRLRPAGGPPVRTSTRGVALRLVFDTGERVDVVGEGLVGRSPAAEPGVVHLVAIDDPERSVSKVHLAFGLDRSAADGPRLWVIDRGSTNGTVLVRPDGSGATLPAGRRAVVEAGWTVCFGSRNARVETV